MKFLLRYIGVQFWRVLCFGLNNLCCDTLPNIKQLGKQTVSYKISSSLYITSIDTFFMLVHEEHMVLYSFFNHHDYVVYIIH